MTNPHWNQNEIVQAYEKNFPLLEEARKEYKKSASALLGDIAALLKDRQSELEMGTPFKVKFTELEGDGFAQGSILCEIHSEDDFCPLWIVLRLASPWGGTSGCLQVGVLADSPNQPTEDLRQTVQSLSISSGVGRTMSVTSCAPDWIHGVELEITANIGQTAADCTAGLLRKLAPLAASILDRHLLDESLPQILAEVFQDLKQPSALPTGWSPSGEDGLAKPWEQIRYIQINDSNGGFWVGYHEGKQNLMYGHHKRGDNPGFSQRFFAAAKAQPPESYKGYPAGVIIERNDLRLKLPEETKKVIADLFPLFCRMVQESSPSAGPESP